MKCELKSVDCCGDESCSTTSAESSTGFSPLAVIVILLGAIVLGVAIRYGVSYLVK